MCLLSRRDEGIVHIKGGAIFVQRNRLWQILILSFIVCCPFLRYGYTHHSLLRLSASICMGDCLVDITVDHKTFFYQRNVGRNDRYHFQACCGLIITSFPLPLHPTESLNGHHQINSENSAGVMAMILIRS